MGKCFSCGKGTVLLALWHKTVTLNYVKEHECNAHKYLEVINWSLESKNVLSLDKGRHV